jgi:hypothetical protein
MEYSAASIIIAGLSRGSERKKARKEARISFFSRFRGGAARIETCYERSAFPIGFYAGEAPGFQRRFVRF